MCLSQSRLIQEITLSIPAPWKMSKFCWREDRYKYVLHQGTICVLGFSLRLASCLDVTSEPSQGWWLVYFPPRFLIWSSFDQNCAFNSQALVTLSFHLHWSQNQNILVVQKHWEGPGHCGGWSKNCLRWIRKFHTREMKHISYTNKMCPHILFVNIVIWLHQGVEVLGVAEAWVPGGDQGQLRKAGELDSIIFTSNFHYQFCGHIWMWSPDFLETSVIYECSVRERANDGPAECGYGYGGGLPRIKSCRTLPSQVGERSDWRIHEYMTNVRCVHHQELRRECADIFPLHCLEFLPPPITQFQFFSCIFNFLTKWVASYIVVKYIVMCFIDI